MDSFWKKVVWQQFGAAIDTLENAMVACPESLWSDRSRAHRSSGIWSITRSSGSTLTCPTRLRDFLPRLLLDLRRWTCRDYSERPYTKNELQAYLDMVAKVGARIEALTDEKAHQRWVFGTVDLSMAELLLYNMRHVQHHAAQLNLILRQP